MPDALPALISFAGAILGVVVGAVITQRYQRRNTQIARLHEDRIDAYSEFIDAVVEYRRTHLNRVLGQDASRSAGASADAAAARSATWAAYYKVKLLAGDDTIIDAATETHALTRRLKDPSVPPDEVRQRAQACIGSLNHFVVVARAEVMSGPYADNIKRTMSR